MTETDNTNMNDKIDEYAKFLIALNSEFEKSLRKLNIVTNEIVSIEKILNEQDWNTNTLKIASVQRSAHSINISIGDLLLPNSCQNLLDDINKAKRLSSEFRIEVLKPANINNLVLNSHPKTICSIAENAKKTLTDLLHKKCTEKLSQLPNINSDRTETTPKVIEQIALYLTTALCIFISCSILYKQINSTEKKDESNIIASNIDSSKENNDSAIKKALRDLSTELGKLPKIPLDKSIVNGQDLTSANETIKKILEIAETIKPLTELFKKDSPQIKLLESIKDINEDRITAIKSYILKEPQSVPKKESDETNSIAVSQANYIKKLQDEVISPLKASAKSHKEEYEKIKTLLEKKESMVSDKKQIPVAIIIPIEGTFNPNSKLFINFVKTIKSELIKNKILNVKVFWEANAKIEEYTDENQNAMMQQGWNEVVSEPDSATANLVLNKMQLKVCEIIYVLGPKSTVSPKIQTSMYLNGNRCNIIYAGTPGEKLVNSFLNSWVEVAKINRGSFRIVNLVNPDDSTDLINELLKIIQEKN
jgi:hypothetical protein